MRIPPGRIAPYAVAAAAALFAAGCGGGSSSAEASGLPQLAAPQAAHFGGSCSDLAAKSLENMTTPVEPPDGRGSG